MGALEPAYRPGARRQLDAFEVGDDEALWNAIVDTLAMICADTQDGTGRAYRIVGEGGVGLWAVRAPCRDRDIYVLWREDTAPDGARVALFCYVGPLPRGMMIL